MGRTRHDGTEHRPRRRLHIFEHPVAGPLTLDWQALQVAMAPDQTLVVCTPPPGDSDTRTGLDFLTAWSSTLTALMSGGV
ncbi:hypothetical protein [Streptomyces sp. NPDC050485]|uniref:MmyB family transcriptional regulator n=1 Tax=Streptomyces sp. NPDC050485 TaxID=3365617 RepID=UPI00378BE277